MSEIEQIFNGAERFELSTGQKSERNIYLYRKLGYNIFKNKKVSERLTLAYLEKNKTSGEFTNSLS
jgi:hypothetical protein